jgi:hypothetical protein
MKMISIGSSKMVQGMKQSKMFKSFQDPQKVIMKKMSATLLIIKVMRGYLGRIRVKKMQMMILMQKEKNLRAVKVIAKCVQKFLEKKNLLLAEQRAAEVAAATNIIQSFFRKFLHLKRNIMIGLCVYT